jgi:hypothetical protein
MRILTVQRLSHRKKTVPMFSIRATISTALMASGLIALNPSQAFAQSTGGGTTSNPIYLAESITGSGLESTYNINWTYTVEGSICVNLQPATEGKTHYTPALRENLTVPGNPNSNAPVQIRVTMNSNANSPHQLLTVKSYFTYKVDGVQQPNRIVFVDNFTPSPGFIQTRFVDGSYYIGETSTSGWTGDTGFSQFKVSGEATGAAAVLTGSTYF